MHSWHALATKHTLTAAIPSLFSAPVAFVTSQQSEIRLRQGRYGQVTGTPQSWDRVAQGQSFNHSQGVANDRSFGWRALRLETESMPMLLPLTDHCY